MRKMNTWFSVNRTENPEVIAIYKEFLDKPNSHKAHELLHTHYVERESY